MPQELFLGINVDPGVFVVLLFLPIVTSIISFIRYVIGLNSIGIYAPIVLTFMFYEFGFNSYTLLSSPVQGLKYGLIITFVIFITTILTYKLIQPLALHYYSKLSIVLTNVVIAIFLLLELAKRLDRDGLLAINTFSLVLVVTLAERFLNLIAFNKKVDKAITLSLETIGIAIFCYLLISIGFLQETLVKYPWIIVLNLPVAYLIGSFTGLRLSEYYRFRDILNRPPDSN